MTSIFEALAARGHFAPLDLQLARTLGEIGGETTPEVLLAVALASRSLREGHTCLLLAEVAGRPLPPLPDDEPAGEEPGPALPPLDALRGALEKSPLVSAGEGHTPLVLDGAGRLYLRRYYAHERALAASLRARAAAPPTRALDEDHARAALARLFAPDGAPPPASLASDGAPDWQRVAAAVALTSRLTLVAGGPGTGKTATVARILALLAELDPRQGGVPLRMLLLAPTGKAAARLVESIRAARDRLPISAEIRARIPDTASTIHRALGATRGGEKRFRHHAGDPLHADVVVVDESSMIDLALARRLVDAVPPGARLILLGDPYQLASVEAGAVFGELCGAAIESCFSPEAAARIERLTGSRLPSDNVLRAASASHRSADDAVVKLTRSYRFDDAGRISALARAVNRGDATSALALLAEPRGGSPHDEIRLHPAPAASSAPSGPGGHGGLAGPFLDEILAGYAAFLAAATPEDALLCLSTFRVLCAHRRGPAGVETLNRQIERALAAHGLLRPSAGAHYHLRPILVTHNDYGAGLFNGDVGVLLRDGKSNALRAYFPGPTASGETAPARALAPARLPPHETVFAMTVHKSQGSEFDRVAVVLPDPGSPLLVRELLYTAVTRARRAVTLFGSAESVAAAIEHPVIRASGLGDALRANSSPGSI